jgi:hypothetical protein
MKLATGHVPVVSQKTGESFELGDGGDASLLGEDGEILLGRIGWVLKTGAHPGDGAAKDARRKIQMVAQELVRMLGLDTEGGERRSGKCLRFWVTITSQRPMIAAARTWRSPSSGRVSVEISGS